MCVSFVEVAKVATCANSECVWLLLKQTFECTLWKLTIPLDLTGFQEHTHHVYRPLVLALKISDFSLE